MEQFLIPTVEDLNKEMQEALSNSNEVLQALSEYDRIYHMKKAMQQMLNDNEIRKQKLTAEKKELSEKFGESPADTKKLENFFNELAAIKEAKELLEHRLKDDGEMDRMEKDAGYAVGRKVAAALEPIGKKYQQVVDELFNGLADLLNRHREALQAVWPRKTGGGVFLRSDGTERRNSYLSVSDVEYRLGNFTNEFAAKFLHAANYAKSQNPPAPPATSPRPVIPTQQAVTLPQQKGTVKVWQSGGQAS